MITWGFAQLFYFQWLGFWIVFSFHFGRGLGMSCNLKFRILLKIGWKENKLFHLWFTRGALSSLGILYPQQIFLSSLVLTLWFVKYFLCLYVLGPTYSHFSGIVSHPLCSVSLLLVSLSPYVFSSVYKHSLSPCAKRPNLSLYLAALQPAISLYFFASLFWPVFLKA